MKKHKAKMFQRLFRKAFPKENKKFVNDNRRISSILDLSTANDDNWGLTLKKVFLYLGILKDFGEEFSKIASNREKTALIVSLYSQNTEAIYNLPASITLEGKGQVNQIYQLAMRKLTDIAALVEYLNNYWEIEISKKTLTIMLKDQGFYDKFCIGEESLEDMAEILGKNYRLTSEIERISFNEFMERLIGSEHRSIVSAIESTAKTPEELEPYTDQNIQYEF